MTERFKVGDRVQQDEKSLGAYHFTDLERPVIGTVTEVFPGAPYPYEVLIPGRDTTYPYNEEDLIALEEEA